MKTVPKINLSTKRRLSLYYALIGMNNLIDKPLKWVLFYKILISMQVEI